MDADPGTVAGGYGVATVYGMLDIRCVSFRILYGYRLHRPGGCAAVYISHSCGRDFHLRTGLCGYCGVLFRRGKAFAAGLLRSRAHAAESADHGGGYQKPPQKERYLEEYEHRVYEEVHVYIIYGMYTWTFCTEIGTITIG